MSGFRRTSGSSQKTKFIFWTYYTETVTCPDKDKVNRRNNARVEKRMIGLSMSWLDDVKAKTRLRLEKAMQAAADQDNCRRVAHDVTNPWTQDGYRTEQNRADILTCTQNILHQICTNWVIHHLVQN